MTILRALSFTLVALLFVPSAQAQQDNDAWRIPTQKQDFHIFLLMGQSNMSGYGKLQPEDRKGVPRVLLLPTKGKVIWRPASHPLHNRLKSDRFGLGLPFATEYLKDKPNITVGLIPVAWGGAAIDRLNKGTPTFSDAIKKAQFAAQEGTIKGVLWHQGESDTVSESRASAFEQKLHQLVSDCRAELAIKQLPFIAGNLAEFYGTGKDHRAADRVKRINKVRGALRDLPKHVANTGFVESTGCSSPDQHMVHFDRASYIILGKRYAEVYNEVSKALKGQSSK